MAPLPRHAYMHIFIIIIIIIIYVGCLTGTAEFRTWDFPGRRSLRIHLSGDSCLLLFIISANQSSRWRWSFLLVLLLLLFSHCPLRIRSRTWRQCQLTRSPPYASLP